MKTVMVAGGSGGHIYPATALAKGMIDKGHEVTFIGSNDRMEKDVIPSLGYKYIGIDVYTTSGGIANKVKSMLSIITAYFKCLKLLKGYDLAIGFGNYISVPVMLAAKTLKIKTVIHEQNSFVGRANRLLDKGMDLIIGSYEEDKEQFKNQNIMILGNPRSSLAYGIEKDPELFKNMGLNPEKKTVVIFMGSLGSETVNRQIISYLKNCDDRYQVIYATGKANYENVLSENIEDRNIKIFERIDGIAVMNNADLLVSRAGATTLAEVSAIGIPSILIPSPFVPNNHQYYNAKALTDKNAAIMLEEKELSAERLKKEIDSVLFDDDRLKEISENAKEMANKDVIKNIIEAVEKL